MRFLHKKWILIYFGVFSQWLVSSQAITAHATPCKASAPKNIEAIFDQYETYEIDLKSLLDDLQYRQHNDNPVYLSFGDSKPMCFNVEPSELWTDSTFIYELGPTGKSLIKPNQKTKTYRGSFCDGRNGYIRLTIHDTFIYAVIHDRGKEYFIEPLKYYDAQAKANQCIFFSNEHVSSKHRQKACFRPHVEIEERIDEASVNRSAGLCYTAKLAVLADYSMVIDPAHLGVEAVIDHIVGVINNVQGNYEYNGTTNFNDGIQFELSEIILSTCPTCDPLSNQTNSGNLLAEFSNWADRGGFAHANHAAHFWTNRDLSGSTVGVAFQSANLYCQNKARAVFEDWTTNAALLKILVSHELGHTFLGLHDPSNTNFILSPTINIQNTTWSAASKTAMSTQISNQGQACLSSCAPATCPRLDDVSISNITNQQFIVSWQKVLGATYLVKVREIGSTNFLINIETDTNALVLIPSGYTICKKYDVFVYRKCSATNLSIPIRIQMISPTTQGCADFIPSATVGWRGTTVQFVDKSIQANAWLWNFGNGQTSTLQNPSMTYTESGNYTVSLTVNGLHQRTYQNLVQILPNISPPFGLNNGGNFESNAHFFSCAGLEGTENVWEYGNSNYVLASQGKAWKSKLNSDIPQLTSKSALYSPRFNFTGYENYVLEFDIGMEVQFCNAPFAVQLQYSLNNGVTWTRLGNSPSFYNAGAASTCKISTFIFPDSTGWTFNGNYVHKTLDVSFLTGNPTVIFRFVISISGIFNGGYAVDGVLIDNFQIGASEPTALPLVPNSLEAFIMNDQVRLSWKSVYPVDIHRFVIHRSHDGSRFVAIDTIANTQKVTSLYHYADHNIHSGISYYQVEALTYQQRSQWTNIASVVNQTFENIQVYPTCSIDVEPVYIKWNSRKEVVKNIAIYNSIGQQLQVIPIQELTSDVLPVTWSKGSYHIQFNMIDGTTNHVALLKW